MCDWECGTWDPAILSSFDCLLRHQSTDNVISWYDPCAGCNRILMFLTTKWKWKWLRFSGGLLPPPGPPSRGGFPPPPNPLSVAPKKHIVALNKLERLRDLPLRSQHNMATSRSKTLSKTDLLSWRYDAIICAFERNIATSNIAHIFDVTQRQVQRLQAQWLSSLFSATMCFALKVMSQCLNNQWHVKIWLGNIPSHHLTAICTRRHYSRQALYCINSVDTTGKFEQKMFVH